MINDNKGELCNSGERQLGQRGRGEKDKTKRCKNLKKKITCLIENI